MTRCTFSLLLCSVTFAADPKLPDGAVAKVDTSEVVKPWRARPVLSADGKTLAVRVPNGFDLIDLGTGKAVEVRDDTDKRVLSPKTSRDSGDTMLAFALDGKTVLTANQQKCVSVWDAATGKHLRDVPMPKRERDAYGAATDDLYPADRLFTSTHLKAVVVIGAGQVFTLDAKDKFTTLECYDAGHLSHVTTNGRWIASAETSSSIEDNFGVTDVSKKKSLDNTAGHFSGSVGQSRYAGNVSTSDDGQFVAVGYTGGAKDCGVQLHRYDGKGQVELTDATGEQFSGHLALGFSSDAKTVYCVVRGVMFAWDTATGKRGTSVALPAKAAVKFDTPRDRVLVLGGGYVYAVELK